MKLNRIVVMLCALSGLALSPGAQAIGNFGDYSITLWNSPARFYTDADWKLFQDTLETTLKEEKDGGTRSWSNPATGASGEFTILGTVQKDDTPCRKVKVIWQMRTLRRVSGMAFCKQDDGDWKVVGH